MFVSEDSQVCASAELLMFFCMPTEPWGLQGPLHGYLLEAGFVLFPLSPPTYLCTTSLRGKSAASLVRTTRMNHCRWAGAKKIDGLG